MTNTRRGLWRAVLVLMTSLQRYCMADHYTNHWAVHIEGGEDVARQLAEKHGFTYVDKVRSRVVS